MVNFVLFDATIPSPEALKSLPLVHFVDRLVHNIHAKHEAQELTHRDDHMLHDIGLLRGDVESAAHVTVTHDAMAELHDAQIRHEKEADEELDRQSDDGLKATSLRSRKLKE